MRLLQDDPRTRESDKILMWRVWECQGITVNGALYQPEFLSRAIMPESIRRVRQKIQETKAELRPVNATVRMLRRVKQATKGTFIYRETTDVVAKQEELAKLF